MINWESKLSIFGNKLLKYMHYNYLPTDHNPITQALKNDAVELVEGAKGIKGYSMTAMSRLATICQMNAYDQSGGPEQDRECKALRRHWYAWYKTTFAQPYSEALGEDLQSERWGLNWSGRLSQTYAKLVDRDNVTYKDLWVKDASRMMSRNWEELFQNANIVICVEKDSLFEDFEIPARSMGAKAVYSGKGKSSKAAIEKMLREMFNWSNGYSSITYDNPLVVLSITDWDYDGEAVIAPTFAAQARRYTDNVVEVRVGIKPEQVNSEDWSSKWYQVKIKNKAYIEWADQNAIWDNDLAFGFEVEALTTRSYRALMVLSLIEAMPFSKIIERLRDECRADSWRAADILKDRILDKNASYQNILAEFERLQKIKVAFEKEVQSSLERAGCNHTGDWWNLEDNPTENDFIAHVETRREVWRPFSKDARTEKLASFLVKKCRSMIVDFFKRDILAE